MDEMRLVPCPGSSLWKRPWPVLSGSGKGGRWRARTKHKRICGFGSADFSDAPRVWFNTREVKEIEAERSGRISFEAATVERFGLIGRE